MYKKYSFKWPAEKDYTFWDKFTEVLDSSVQYLYNILNVGYFDKQSRKVSVKLHRYDTWSMDSTAAFIILPLLKQLKEQKNGAPFVEYEDVPKTLRPSKKELASMQDGDTDVYWFERWDWVLNEIIFAFSSCNSDWQDEFTSGVIKYKTVPIDENGNKVDKKYATLYRFEEEADSTYKIDYEGMKKYQKRISNGYRLFGKYYECLWS